MQKIHFNNNKYKIIENQRLCDYFKISDDETYRLVLGDSNIILHKDCIINFPAKIITVKKWNNIDSYYIQDLMIHIFNMAIFNIFKNKILFTKKIIKSNYILVEFEIKDNLVNNLKFIIEKEIGRILKLKPRIICEKISLKIGKSSDFNINNYKFKCKLFHLPFFINNLYFKIFSYSTSKVSDNKIICNMEIASSDSIKVLKENIKSIDKQRSNDHRFINKKVKYYEFNNKIGAGLPIWTERGKIIKDSLEIFLDDLQINKYGYNKIQTSPIGSKDLYITSTHLKYYKNTMFPSINTIHGDYILRPMTCPHHCVYFNSQQISYKNLPYKLYETSQLFRYETSGGLKGLERTRWMTLSDCHTFLSEDQISDHIKDILEQLNILFNTFKIKLSHYRLSIPDDKEMKFFNVDISIWNKSVSILENILKLNNVNYIVGKGEAAFYGPKIDIQIINSNNIEITLATIQLDYFLPKQFKLSYVDSNGCAQMPIIIHHSLIGTYERFISILMEQSRGYMPIMISPLNFVIISISNKENKYINQLYSLLIEKKYRVFIDLNNERLNYKIRKYELLRANYIIIIGDSEINNKTISVRDSKNNNVKNYTYEKFLAFLDNEKN